MQCSMHVFTALVFYNIVFLFQQTVLLRKMMEIMGYSLLLTLHCCLEELLGSLETEDQMH